MATPPDGASPAVLLMGHGTRLATGVAEFQALAAQLQAQLPDRRCAAAFLELSSPGLSEVLETLWQEGVRRITALPAFLLAAGHVKHDLPTLLRAFEATHPGLSITFGRELGLHPALLALACERIAEAEARFNRAPPRSDTLLLVIGRGSSDPDANANMYKITRLLWEEMGFGWAETAYTAIAQPYMDEAIERVHRLGFGHLIVLPYLLFSGRLTEQVQAVVADYQTRHPKARVALAPHLNAHPQVVKVFLERLAQAEETTHRSADASL